MRWVLAIVGMTLGTGLMAQHTGPGARHLPSTPVAPNRSGHWPSWNGSSRPGGYHQPQRERYPYVYPGLLSFGYGLPFGYGLTGEDAASPQPSPPVDYGPPATDSQLAEAASPPYRPVYPGAATVVHPQPATTLIFNDGRPPGQVHNYALLGGTLWALDGETRQEIPLDSLNLPATVKANRDAGVDFALPNRP